MHAWLILGFLRALLAGNALFDFLKHFLLFKSEWNLGRGKGRGGGCFFFKLSKFHWHAPILVHNKRIPYLSKISPGMYTCRDNNTWASTKYTLFRYKYFWNRVFECFLRDHTSRAISYAFHHVAAFCLMRNLIILRSPSLPLSKKEVTKTF